MTVYIIIHNILTLSRPGFQGMNTSPSPKRIKLDSSPSASSDDPRLKPEETAPGDDPDDRLEQPEEEHCTICLQPFLDKTIIPVCAHEFCFECILLWSGTCSTCPNGEKEKRSDSFFRC